jgi:adenine C2-methylase RlmN of 23S rRNA A2503 and tRNA A37
MTKFSIHDESRVQELLIANGHKAFRYAQLENALYKNFISNFEEIETLPKDIRTLLQENCFYQSLEVHSTTTSEN